MEHTTNTSAKKLPLYRSLSVQVITAVIIGVLLGYFYPAIGESMKPLGDDATPAASPEATASRRTPISPCAGRR